MSGYGSIYGGYYGGRGPARQNEGWMRPNWNTKYNGYGGYGGYGDDYNYAGVPGVSYNGGYRSYAGPYAGYGYPYGNGFPPYVAGGPQYVPTPPISYPYSSFPNVASLPANGVAAIPAQQPGASPSQPVSSIYPNVSSSQTNNPNTTLPGSWQQPM